MTIRVVLNRQTAHDAQRSVQAWVDDHDEAALSSTKSPAEARDVVRRAIDGGVDRIIAAGGDGTLSLVTGAMLDQVHGAVVRRERNVSAPTSIPAVGLCPLGTGNDYARSLALPSETHDVLDLAARADPTRVDVLRATRTDGNARDVEPRWVVNAAAGGFSGEVDEAISRAQKDRWGALAFILGAADIAPDIPQYATEIRYVTPSGEERHWSGDTVNVICANGQTIGGGRNVAPMARLNNGCFELVVVRHGDLPDLARTAARLLAGSWEEDDLVDILRVQSAAIRSVPGLKFNVDGDLWTERPIHVETVPGALRVVAGADAPALQR
jgi:diacylglycerol kinase (ATP)